MIDPTDSSATSIWDPTNGFGGNGSASDGCVQDGPLENILLNYTGDGYDPHCLSRNLRNTTAFYGGDNEVVRDIVENAETYEDFRESIEKGPHKHIHMGIGGEMGTEFSTNGECIPCQL
jgi:tyrosinase